MKTRVQLAVASTFLATAIAHHAAASQAPTTERVSVATGGTQGNGDSYWASISADGRFVAFYSAASNFSSLQAIYVRDRTSGTTELVGPGLGYPSISSDGRFVAFTSGNNAMDVFLRDRVNGTTELVSVATTGVSGSGTSDLFGSNAISDDGRFVVFVSFASDLVVGDANQFADIFVRDRSSGITELVSVATGGGHGNGPSYWGSVSGDGRFVAFDSYASNLVAGDTNGKLDVFVRDLVNATTERVSIDSAEAQGSKDSFNGSLSFDGRFVAFLSSSLLVAGDTNGHRDVFVRDRLNGTTERASVSTSGVQGSHDCRNASISADGRWVVFEALSPNLVAGDTNGAWDIFVHHLGSGTTDRVSLSSSGAEANLKCFNASISGDGSFVAFDSAASNLVTNDTNGYQDVFVRDRGPMPPDAYCTAGTTTHGCRASIAASANPSVSLANPCNLSVSNVEGQKSGILFYGNDNATFMPAPWAPSSTSFLCVKPPTQRTPIQDSGGTLNACDGSYLLDWNAYQSANPSALGNPWNVGGNVYVQAWFRDPPAPKSTNLSNAVEMTYVP